MTSMIRRKRKLRKNNPKKLGGGCGLLIKGEGYGGGGRLFR